MAFCQINWFSQVLGTQVTTWVLLPDTEGPDAPVPPFATLYLLHGLTQDHTAWLRRTRLETYAAELPLIIVMPDGGRGYFTNHNNGPKWATHIGEELPNFIERTFPARVTRASRCIGGLSMGGYGALRIALAYPRRFSSVNSHSGSLMIGTMPHHIPERVLIFGHDPTGTNHDLTHLAARAKNEGVMPRLKIDCGIDDFLLDENRAFHRSLLDQHIDHEYSEHPGGHTWDYWDEHVRDAIKFHMAGLSNEATET